jgi:hypothetical protein
MTYALLVLLSAWPLFSQIPLGGITGGAVAGSLTCTVNNSTSLVNLTTLGTTNWAMFGVGSSLIPSNTMSGGTGSLSAATTGSPSVAGTSGFNIPFIWSNGTPNASESTGVTWGIYVYNLTPGPGYALVMTAPASTVSHDVYFFVALYQYTAVTATVHLSDSSATDYTDTESDAGGLLSANYHCTYAAASGGQTITLTWAVATGISSSNLALQAMAYE